jgi:hypothetical protein
MAWSNRPWVLDGAAVRVSMIGFDSGGEINRTLDSVAVTNINSDLTSKSDLTQARFLPENRNISYIGTQKGAQFDIPSHVAQQLLNSVGNPNGQPNTDVIKPWINGLDITRRPNHYWIIDFNEMPIEDAAQYDAPFEYVRNS